MPIYAYKCASCGFAKDVLQKISDDPLSVCPQCAVASFSKQVTAAGFQLKGSGWYVTDFRGGNTAAPAAEDAGKADAALAAGAAANATKATEKTATKPDANGSSAATSTPSTSAPSGTSSASPATASAAASPTSSATKSVAAPALSTGSKG